MNSSIAKMCLMIKAHPSVLQPFRGMNSDISAIFSAKGFQLYPTVKKTTLFYDPATDCFFKILHPLNLKNRVLSCLTDRARAIYKISEQLSSKHIRLQKVVAYGMIKKGRLPFFVIKKAEGESLYDIMIRGGKTIAVTDCMKVIDEIAALHSLGFWLGDAHLSHIFMKDSEVSGIIDIDSIRKNIPFRIKNLAKDIAGINHPGVTLTPDEKKLLLDYYLKKAAIKNKKKFLELIDHYTERRWKQ